MSVASFNEFSSRDELAKTLAATIAEPLAELSHGGRVACVAFSGGSTPKQMLARFAGHWERFNADNIVVTLIDERFVPPSDQLSNQRMLNDHLFTQTADGERAASTFVPLFHGGASSLEDCSFAEKTIANRLAGAQFTACVMGMGLDGHTASWFPDGDNLDAATSDATPAMFVPMNANSAQVERLTMTLPPIVRARHVFLHIEGEDKRAIFEQAQGEGDANELPVRHLLRHPDIELHVYWAS